MSTGTHQPPTTPHVDELSDQDLDSVAGGVSGVNGTQRGVVTEEITFIRANDGGRKPRDRASSFIAPQASAT